MENTKHPERQPILFTRRQDKIQKTKRETKELGTETRPREGVVKEEKFPNTRKPSHQRVCGEFWNLRGKHNRGCGGGTNTKNTHLTATPSGEVAQMLASTTSKQGLNREVQTALLRVRSRPECEGNLREPT